MVCTLLLKRAANQPVKLLPPGHVSTDRSSSRLASARASSRSRPVKNRSGHHLADVGLHLSREAVIATWASTAGKGIRARVKRGRRDDDSTSDGLTVRPPAMFGDEVRDDMLGVTVGQREASGRKGLRAI